MQLSPPVDVTCRVSTPIYLVNANVEENVVSGSS